MSSPADATAGGDYLPTATIQMLQLRAKLLAELRRFFDSRGYWEVETPILSHEIIVDAWLEPFATQMETGVRNTDPSPHSSELFLQTSPEFGMKRLLTAGARAIYQITRAFRKGEAGRYHNPEFTMVEWYRVGDSHREQMQVVEELVVEFFAAAKSEEQQPFKRPIRHLSYDEAFEQYAGTRVLHLSPDELAKLAERHKISPPRGLRADDRDGWLNLLLAEIVEPQLGRDRPVFLYDYPASQAALARIRVEEPPVAERFELYIEGIEVCNGYHELTDPRELRRRMEGQSKIREREGSRSLPMRNRLLKAMDAGLPACSGVALGFDRLMMLAVKAESLADVMAFPIDRA